jgi:hypothetical protein
MSLRVSVVSVNRFLLITKNFIHALILSFSWMMNHFFVYKQIYFKRKKTGGISFNSTAPLTHIDEKLCYQILHEYKIHNAEVCACVLVCHVLAFSINSNHLAYL